MPSSQRIIGASLLLVVVLAVIGLLLPAHFHVERSIEIVASPEKICGLIADPREWKRRTKLSDAEFVRHAVRKCAHDCVGKATCGKPLKRWGRSTRAGPEKAGYFAASIRLVG